MAERTEPNLGNFNLIAAFPDMEAAERALERLRQVGVRGEEVSLLQRRLDHLVETDDEKTDDRETIADAVKGTVLGALGGGVAGALAGFLVGLALLPIPGVGPVLTAGVWATTGLGAVGGGTAGSLVGVITGAALSNDKDETYRTHLERGHVLVGVHIDDPVRFQTAFDTLVLSQPLSIDRYGAGAATRA
jgi:hypothetical protein